MSYKPICPKYADICIYMQMHVNPGPINIWNVAGVWYSDKPPPPTFPKFIPSKIFRNCEKYCRKNILQLHQNSCMFFEILGHVSFADSKSALKLPSTNTFFTSSCI